MLLWIVIASFQVLTKRRLGHPRIYDHYPPTPPWPGEPENFGLSKWGVVIYFAFLFGGLGFLQSRFGRWFHRGTSRILLWHFVLLSLGTVADACTFALATRFWTRENRPAELSQALHTMELGSTLARYGLKSGLAVGALNIAVAVFRKRNS